ncbi:MAG: O-antigen ligase family protein [Nitrospirae bacterium]|nr:O-antigen ligase family protein [Nitrospirota bacterium]
MHVGRREKMMGFGQSARVVDLSGESSRATAAETFILPKIPWPYFAITLFMGFVAADDVNVPRAVLLVLSAVVFYSLLMKSLVRPVYGLIALAAFIPYSKAIAGNLGGMIPGLNYTTVLTLITLVGFFSNSKNIEKYEALPLEASFRRLLLVFCGLVAFSVLHTDISDSSLTVFSALVDYKRWFDPLMVFFLTSYLVQEEEDARKILYMMAFTLVVIGIGTYWQRHELDNRSHYVRLTGLAGQANTMGAFYANYAFVMIGYLVMKGMKRIRRGIFFVGIVGCLLGLSATQSRGDALGFVGGMTIFFLLRNRLQFLVYVAAVVFVAYNPQFLPGGLKQRVERTVQHQSNGGLDDKTRLDASARTRLALWKGAIRMIEANPVMGVGYKMFQTYIFSFVDHNEETAGLELKGRDGHNAYLMIGAEMGLPTLLVFLAILVFMFRIGWRSFRMSPDPFWKTVSVCALASITSLVITNMFGSRVFSLVLTGYLWMMLAILLKMPRWAERRSGTKEAGLNPGLLAPSRRPVFSSPGAGTGEAQEAARSEQPLRRALTDE